MPYYPILAASSRLPPNLSAVVGSIERWFADFHDLLTFRNANQGPKGSYQHPQAMVLIALADGAAQFLWPNRDTKLEDGDRFKEFYRYYYPWKLDPPCGFTQDEAVDFLWSDIRCAILHRFGLRFDAAAPHKFGNVFATTDAALEAIERRTDQRPFTEPFLKRGNGRTVFWVESFYWGVRQSIAAALSAPQAQIEEVENWIASGDFDPKVRRKNAKAQTTKPAS